MVRSTTTCTTSRRASPLLYFLVHALVLTCFHKAPRPCLALVVPITAANPAKSLQGITLSRVADGTEIDLGDALAGTTATGDAAASEMTMLILGTHPADFNMIEYCQRAQA